MKAVTTLKAAAAFVDRVGLAALFPTKGNVLPSLLEATGAALPAPWDSTEMQRCWRWKDELGEQKLCLVGKHVRTSQMLISVRVLPAMYALTGRAGEPGDFRDDAGVLSPLEFDVASAVLDAGVPISAPEIRKRIQSKDTAKTNRAVETLQRALVLTRAGNVEQEQGWPASTVDIVTRRYPLATLPGVEDARRTLIDVVRNTVPGAGAAQVASALGWTKRQAQAVLDEG